MFFFYLALFFLFLIFVLTPLIAAYQIAWAIADYLGVRDWYNRRLFFQWTDPLVKDFLQKNFKYYQNLDDKDKVTFERRVQKFIGMKTFEAREGLYVTIEMEALVAAAAIQITFGFPSIYFSHFDRIILYPDVYYSSITDAYHRGEVNTRGVIVLSWKNLWEGYLHPADGRNLGLHEMAHALKVTDSINNAEYDFLDVEVLREFHFYARHEMELIAGGDETFFRRYAATNEHEFFAISVENFFERPKEFEEFHPELYNVMRRLLNQ